MTAIGPKQPGEVADDTGQKADGIRPDKSSALTGTIPRKFLQIFKTGTNVQAAPPPKTKLSPLRSRCLPPVLPMQKKMSD